MAEVVVIVVIVVVVFCLNNKNKNTTTNNNTNNCYSNTVLVPFMTILIEGKLNFSPAVVSSPARMAK